VCRAYRRVAPGDLRVGTGVYADLAGELQQDTHGKVPVGIYSLQQGRAQIPEHRFLVACAMENTRRPVISFYLYV